MYSYIVYMFFVEIENVIKCYSEINVLPTLVNQFVNAHVPALLRHVVGWSVGCDCVFSLSCVLTYFSTEKFLSKNSK